MPTFTNCTGVSRRDALQLGLGTLLGGGLVTALRARGFAAEAVNTPAAKAKACILIWMDGGPTHYETFDPKPDAPAEYPRRVQGRSRPRCPACTSPST